MNRKLSTNQLLYLVAIRSLTDGSRPLDLGILTRFLGKPKSTVYSCLDGNFDWEGTGLRGRGLVTWRPDQMGTIRLTEAGREAVKGMALVREKGRVWVGQVEKK